MSCQNAAKKNVGALFVRESQRERTSLPSKDLEMVVQLKASS